MYCNIFLFIFGLGGGGGSGIEEKEYLLFNILFVIVLILKVGLIYLRKN